MAMGRPIITTNAPGCRETVQDGYNGYLVEPGNINDLVEKMLQMLNDKNSCQEMAERSIKLAREKYDVRLVNHEIMKTMGLL